MIKNKIDNLEEVGIALDVGISIISAVKHILKNNNILGATSSFSFKGKKFKLKLEVEETK